MREVNHRGPKNALVLVLWKPEIEVSNDAKIIGGPYCAGSGGIVADDAECYVCRRKPRKLRFHVGDVPALWVEFQNTPHESSETILDLDARRLAQQGELVDVHQDQATFGAERQSDLNETAFLRVHGLPCPDFEMDITVQAIPFPLVVARIAIGQVGLTQNAVLVENRSLVRLLDMGGGGFDQTFLNGGRAFDLPNKFRAEKLTDVS
jgi:hypothetical protein